MNYATIKPCDVANGPGVRVSLFVSGCTHQCMGCFNEEAWDFSYGKEFTKGTIEEIITYLEPSYIRGLSLLGGEPFELSNQQGLLPLLREVKLKYPQKDIWCYSGYQFEQDILEDMCEKQEETKELVSYLDVLVDGKFILEQKNINLRFRGSSNQRIIKVKESLEAKTIVLWEAEGNLVTDI
jgi:anaerobic ribonucleoside-triphosphate reductase activating protein